jgi:ABC-type transporter Mla MlaB component
LAAPEESPTTPLRELRPGLDGTALVLVVSGRIARADIAGLCEHARVLLEGGDADIVVCDVRDVADPDVVTVDALARLQLTARRLGRRVHLRHACAELQELLALTGLSDVVPVGGESGLQPGGQIEERKEAGGVEEETDPADPAV